MGLQAKAAEFAFTARALLEWCTSDEQADDISAALRTYRASFMGARVASQMAGSVLCVLEHSTRHEARDVFIRMIRTHMASYWTLMIQKGAASPWISGGLGSEIIVL